MEPASRSQGLDTLGSSATGTRPDRVSADVLWFARAATILVAVSVGIEVLALVLGLFDRPAAPAILVVTVAGLALAWLVASRGLGWPAVWIAVGAYLWAAIAGAIWLPTFFITVLALPAAATLAAVPFLRGRRLVAMLALVWGIAIAAVGIGLALHPPAGSDAAGIVATILSLVLVAAFATLQLVRVSEAFRRDRDVARVSEARYRALFEGSPVATLVFDPETLRILAANGAAEETYGASRAELLELTTRDLVAPSFLAAFDAARDRYRSDDLMAIPPGARHRRLDGTVIDIEGSSMLVSFDGRPARLSVVLDVTEQRRLAAEAAEAAVRLDEAQAVAHVGTWSLDAVRDHDVEGGTLRWSVEALRILGLPPDTETVDSVYFYTLVHPDDLALVRTAVRETGDRGAAYDLEHRIVRPDGEVRLVHERGDVVRDGDGRVVRFVGTIEDVTERRELERRLEAAQRLETIGRLASGVAHDFNNLLLVISGNAEIALEDLGPDHPAREPVEAIASTALRSAGITRELLAFARRQRADPRPIRLDEAVDDVLPAIRDLVPPTVSVEVRHAAAAPVVVVDQAALERILVNLATNARDAMPGGGTLTISTGLRTMADGAVRGVLAVTDSGMGMAPDVIDRAFEPFYSTKRAPGASPAVRFQGGSGLGLAIVAGLVEDAGGAIELESRVGHGSTFRILLPVSTEAPVQVGPELAAGADRRCASILLVEDDGLVAAFVRTALASAGHAVTLAATADEAWEDHLAPSMGAIEAAGPADDARPDDDEPAFDLVISDIVMPGIGGAELARRLATRQPRIPTILMSGYTDEVEALTAVARPTAFLDKPFTVAQLLGAVDRALAATASPGVAAPTPPAAAPGAAPGSDRDAAGG
jgi:two-component system cell cycle sensor histidine kinase/response regulator CckA